MMGLIWEFLSQFNRHLLVWEIFSQGLASGSSGADAVYTPPTSPSAA